MSIDISTAIAAVKSAYYGRDVRQAFVDALNTVEAAVNGIDLSQVVKVNTLNHNSIFRGADLSAKYKLTQVCDMVGNGDFSDVFIGDYFPVSGSFSVPTVSGGTMTVEYSTKLRVAGINTYLMTGASLFDNNHIVVIPDDTLCNVPMNATETTDGGFTGTYVYKQVLPAITRHFTNLVGGLTSDNKCRLLKRSVQLTTGVDGSLTSMAGTGLTGASSTSDISTERGLLPSEVEIFGGPLCGSSNLDIGFANRQLPLFRIAPEFITKQRQYYWLSAVADKTRFVFVDADAACSYTAANHNSNIGIRPILTLGGLETW